MSQDAVDYSQQSNNNESGCTVNILTTMSQDAVNKSPAKMIEWDKVSNRTVPLTHDQNTIQSLTHDQNTIQLFYNE